MKTQEQLNDLYNKSIEKANTIISLKNELLKIPIYIETKIEEINNISPVMTSDIIGQLYFDLSNLEDRKQKIEFIIENGF